MIFLVLVTIYIAVRFEWKMALATLAALLHDILVTIGVYSLAGFLVTPATVIAFLTILGYSIYDGIVVFDRVDENQKSMGGPGRGTYSEMVNTSLNQVLMRTLNTSITALLPILSLLVVGSLVLGATTLEEFALALLVGLAAGAYSSIFIASPLLAVLKEREPRNVALRSRTDSARGPLVPSARRAAAPLARGGRRGRDRARGRPDDGPGPVGGTGDDEGPSRRGPALAGGRRRSPPARGRRASASTTSVTRRLHGQPTGLDAAPCARAPAWLAGARAPALAVWCRPGSTGACSFELWASGAGAGRPARVDAP